MPFKNMIIEMYEHIYVYKLTMDPKWYCSFYGSKFVSYPCPLVSGLQNSLVKYLVQDKYYYKKPILKIILVT